MNLEIISSEIALTILLGLALLMAGRRLFWLCLGGLGFLFGIETAGSVVDDPRLVWLVAILLGLLGAAVAIFLQKVAVLVGGLAIGGYLTLWAVEIWHLPVGDMVWLLVIAGAVVCSLLALWLFEIALVLLSSLAGAVLVADASGLADGPATLFFAALALFGIVFQFRSRRSGKAKR